MGKDLAVSQIQAFLNRPERLEQFKIAFGRDLNLNTLNGVLQDWQGAGCKLPEVKIVSAQILGKADGGFDTVNNQIYLSSNLIERGNLSEIVPVIIEEFGHYLDSKIHPGGDAIGDEGEIFSKLVRGVSISASEYVTLINEDDHTTIILLNSQLSTNSQLSIEQSVTTNYAIKAEKTVSFNGSSDLDGNPLDLSDDALIYGGKGFTFNGNSILPVKYDASGNPVKNSQGKLVLVDKAVTVAAGYLQANVNGTGSKYAGLTPPQIVAAETVTVPLFADIKQQELNRKIPIGTITTTFNISTNPINTAAQWATKFPPAGTATAPKVVRVTGGGLNIPGTVNLSNYVIIVDSGDINFNGTGTLSNVTLVASNGNINLNSIQSDNLSVLASGTINQNSGARFGGNSLFANGTGNITFNGASKGITANDNLWVISAGNITFNGAQSTRGSFVATGDFIANGSANIYGNVSSKQNITFNGALTFTYANILNYSDSTPPVILAGLVNDSGTSNSDKITNDGRISGTVTDASQIVAFKAGFDSKPVANFTDILTYLTNGSFSFTKPQLETIYGGIIPDGSHTLNLIATDQYGNQSSIYPYTFTLDTTIGIPSLQLATVSDTGASNSDKITKINTPTISGTGEIGAKIKINDGNAIVGQVTVGTDGKWQVVTSSLTNGNHSLIATATDLAGNISTASAPLNLVIDALLPQLTLTTPLTQTALKNDARLLGNIDGTGSNLVGVNYYWDNSTTAIVIIPNAIGGFNQGLDFTGINNGSHTLTISATDIAGNILTSNYTVNVDLDKLAPIVNLQLGTDTGSNTGDKITNNPTVTGKITDASGIRAVTVSLNTNLNNSINIVANLQADGSFSLDKAVLTQLNGGQLPDGNYQVYLQAVDNYGNTTVPQILAFQLLTQAIAPSNLQLLASSDTGTSNSDKITKNNQPTIQGNGNAGDTIQLIDGNVLVGASIVGTNGTWQINSSALTDGTHSLIAKAIDIAGNISINSSGLNLNIDTTPPNLQLAQQLAGIVLTGTSHLKGQISDVNITTISYQFDGANPITLAQGNVFDTPFDFTGINDGGHNLTVTATDIAGNVVSHTYGVTVARGTLLTVALLNDTGVSNSDGITSDINVRGQVADRTQISRLEFALDGSTNYTDLTATLQLDGTFRLLPAQLNSLAGGTLNLGTHSLKVRGVLADGTPIATATLNFTYQSANLNRPSLVLAKPSDTGVIGDLVTSATSVDLVAKAGSGSNITLGNRTLVADVNGVATFTGVSLILGGNNFTLTTTASNGEIATSNTTITRTNPDDVILTWNHIALDAIRRENTPPPAAARVLGMVHTAMYDAVNAVEQKYGVYRVDATAPSGADEIAAAAQAAAKILAAIYPNQQAYINAALESSLLDGATAAASAAGIALGNTVAANILAWRQQDGSRNPAAYNPSTEVGKWQPDLPNYDGALFPQWGKVTTFGLTSGSQFRPTGAPSLTSAEYTAAFTETKNYGARDNSLRTADHTQSALFWADGSGTYTPAGHWNDIAATAASLAGKSVLANARIFAQLNIALADAGIAAWDTKYTYNTWRPITAIRQADKDGNSLTSADPNWTPLINTPPFPEYISGHSTFSGAASAVLTNAFGSNFSFNSGSVGLPNVTRSFSSFDQAASEAGQSRVYGGIHFQFSNQDGLTLGKQIGNYVSNNLLLDNSQNLIQVSLTKDTAAFDTTNRDRITNQAGITGKVNLTQPNLKLQVAQTNGTFIDVTSSLDANGNFQLDAAKLTTILGTLTDKAYQLTFKLVDSNGQTVGSNNLSFILDTTAAQTILNPLTGTVTPTVHLTGTATDGNGGTSGRFKVGGGTWTSFSVQPNGSFDKVINAQGLTVGLHQVDVELADLAGNITTQSVSFNVDNSSNIYASPATNPGWGRVFGTGFSLAEGNSLVTQNSIDIALGGSGKRTLDFDLNATFDKSDVKSFGKDRVAVYLVDDNNQPIALTSTTLSAGDSTHPGGVPLFSLSETGSEIIPGLVKFDGTHVQIDVSNVTATSGKLVVQLVNQDGDSGSKLTVTNFTDNIDPNGIPGTSISPAITPVTPGAATILDSYMATNNAQLLLSNVSLDQVTGKYTADLRVQNVGTTTLSQNLAVLLTNLPAGVTVANSSGTHPAGSPYLNFDTAIAPGGLTGGGISNAIRVEINDPNLTAFSFKPVVLEGAAAVLPDLSSLATLTVKVGDKIDIPLQGELAIQTATKLPTGKITGDSHLVFTPAPEQIGSYTFTLIVRNGGTEVSQNITLNVVADPITTTRVTGIIADTNQAGIANVLVELAGYQATTDSSGKFIIILPESSAGDTLKVYGQRIQGGGITYPFIAEKMGLLLGHDIYRGVNNQIDRPIYLPTIDVSTGTTVNPNASTVVSNPRLVGAKVTVDAGSLFDKSGNAFAGILSITEVPTTLTPAALPEHLHPDLVVTIQPGDMVFNTPAKLTLPNRAGYLPCLELDLWSINPNTGLFDKVGRGKVSEDGTVIETISGGIRNSSWSFFSPPPEFDPEPPAPDDDDECKNPDFKSQASSKTGAVSDDLSLVTYQSQGISKGINLHYDSLRAHPNRIFSVSGKIGSPLLGTDYITAKVSIIANGIKQTLPGLNSSQSTGINGGERIWQVDGGRIDTGIQGDLSHLQSGTYQFELETGIRGLRNGNLVGTTETQTDRVIVVNDSDSVFGGGWNVSGLQKLVINEDNSALLIDGAGGHWLFEPPTNNIYQSPTDDFSKLERLADGTFQRTTKDGTRYQFNAQGLMVAAIDSRENTTQHIYNAAGQIQQIIDPVGLTTTFNYTEHRVTSIVDPAGRTTQLKYDTQGNLVSVIDPDGSKNQYGYDSRHQVTSHTDKTGQVKTGTYDQFGRAKTATREDGSIVQINPVQVQGLLNRQQTTNLDDIIAIEKLSANAVSTYIDGNGRVTSTTLNEHGHALARIDEIGVQERKTYNDQNLVTSSTDGRGNTIKYEYDERGNVIKTTEQIAGAATENTDGNLFGDTVRVVTQTQREYGDNSGYYGNTGFNPPRVVGDINNDGYKDVIVRNNNQTYNILMGDADGLFATRSSLPAGDFGDIGFVNQLDLKDVDGDGDLDLIANLPIGGGYGTAAAAASSLQDPVLVYLNQGNGQFNAPQVLPLQALSDGFVTGDFNGDGKLDIIIRSDISSAQANSVYPLVLYTGNGQGGWSQAAINITGINANSSFVGGLQMSAIDVDRDGRTELIFNQPGSLAIYKYVNPCVWLKIDSYATNFNTARTQMTTGDVNHDGLTDIVTIGSQELNIFLGQSNGSFQVKQFNPFDADLRSGASGARLQIVDVNGDGKSDVAIFGSDTNYRQSMKVYTLNAAEDLIQVGNATKVNNNNTINGVSFYTQIDRLADINGDGKAELLLFIQKSTGGGYDLGVIENRSIVRETITLTKSYTYDAVFSQLTSVTDELGRKTLYDLDSNTGNVLKTTRVVGLLDTTSGETDDVITRYTYTSTGQLDLVTDALQHVTDYDYDVRGNLVKTISAKGTTDQTVEQYEYDLAGNRTATIDGLGRRTRYVYNSTNMLLQTVDPLGGTSTYNYDKMGHQTRVIDAMGHETNMTYDSRGRLASTIDANGGTTTDSYDNNGNLVEVRRQKSADRSEDLVTKYQYDARNRLIGSTAADGGITATKYDLNNNLTGNTDSNGNQTKQVYDSRNRLIRTVDAQGNVTKYSYNAVNELIATTDALGHTTTYLYDELGRQIGTTDALSQTTRTEYDKLGNAVATIDANGNRTEYSYDALNRRVQVKDAQNNKTNTVYNKVGDVLSVIDSVNNTTTYTYDALSRLITDTNQLGKSRIYSYDAIGNKLSTIDRDNRKTTYTYDNLDRLTTENWLDTSNNILKTITATYDAVGELTSIHDDKSAYQYQYDTLGRIISIDNQGTVGTPRVELTYQYDRQGNLTAVGDKINGITGATTGYTYDQLDRVSQIIQSGNNVQAKRVDFAYNQLGQLTSLNRYSNLAGTNSVINTIHSYDPNNRLTDIKHGNNLAFYNYQYDSASRITQIGSIDGVVNYNYDQTNQLTGADYSTQTDEAYSYDSNGNRTNSGYQTGTNNQLINDGTYTYQYDDEGNQTKRTEIATGKVTEYVYDYHNHLTKLVFKDGNGSVSKTVEYAYDVNDRRIGKVIDGLTTERFVYDRDQISLVFDGSGSQTHRYLYGTEVDQVLADETSASVFWALTDHQGTVKDLVDNNGTLVNHISYDSFGQIISATNPDIRYGYTGREWDSESGLYYYRTRFYDSGVGRFISEDPIGFDGGDSNLSRYVGNSSNRFVDPNGLQAELWGGLADYNQRNRIPGNPVDRIDIFPLCKCSNNNTKQPSFPAIPPGETLSANINLARKNDNYPFNLSWFNNIVKNKAPWDYKQKGSQYQSIGNFNYGMAGRAANIPRGVLLRSAGWAQRKAGTSRPEWGNEWNKAPYGDDPNDQAWIIKGMDYYDKYYNCNFPKE